MSAFKAAKTPAMFIIPDNDTIINESLALQGIRNYGGKKVIFHVGASGHDAALQHPNSVCNHINNASWN